MNPFSVLALLLFVGTSGWATTIYTYSDGSIRTTEDTTLTIDSRGGWSARKDIAYVLVGNSVTSIAQNAFYYCTSLTNITIPKSVTRIEDFAFGCCTSLTSVNVAEDSPSYSSLDGVLFNKDKSTLIYCGGGKSGSYTIPSSVTNISVGAFNYCTSLTSLTIPKSVTSIGMYAFYNCNGLIEINVAGDNPNYSSRDVVLFNKDKSILIQCVGSISGSYTIPSSVTSIEVNAFNHCTNLTSIIIPNSVTSIGMYAFYNCTGLTGINLAGDNPAYSSQDLVLFNKDKSILIQCMGSKSGNYTIPSSVTSIGAGVFMGCGNLTSITIPSSVTSIGMYAFYGTNLSSIFCLGNAPTSGGDSQYCPATVYVLPTATGYGSTFQGLPVSLVTASQILASPSTFGFFNQTQLDAQLATSRASGRNDVITNPNTYNLYTTSQIHNMAIGDLMLTKSVGGGFTLNYDIEQSSDLQTWTTYAPLSLPLTNLPTDKAFVRIKAKQ